MAIELDSDRALADETEDRFGFVGMARRLAPSIIEASKGDGMVVGLEGRWGSGKTSLLNFLRKELKAAESEKIHTITVAPWLNGDSATLVMSLLGPIADKLESREAELSQNKGILGNFSRKKASEVRALISLYGQKTARRLAPLASLAGHFMPGAQVAAGALKAGGDALEMLSGSEATPSELKRQISEKIAALDVGFVVILDDLDRLEPEQAVEVVRLVRSVADFPKVAYLMCYDREVLAKALKTGLKVHDGDLFLQKIVQLTFAIPLPEPFDLRTHFRNEAEAIFVEVNGTAPDGELLEDLASAVDREGMGLSTPREVKLALNGIRFVYPSIANDVYFPDFCRLHLIKTTNFKLYKWLEEYLSVRSILVTGDGSITNDSKKTLGTVLQKLLPSEEIGAAQSIWALKQFIPGVRKNKEASKRVFSEVSLREAGDAIDLKRLGSPLHYRYYFALTGPKTVMRDDDFNELLEFARSDLPSLKARLEHYARSLRLSDRTWFEHILDRLDDSRVTKLDKETVAGIVLAMSDTMDSVIATDNKPRAFAFSVVSTAVRVAERCLARLRTIDQETFETVSKEVAENGTALNWLVGHFFRDQMWDHGRVGNRPSQPGQWVFTDDFLDVLMDIMRGRLSSIEVQERIAEMPNVSTFLFGWRDISGEAEARDWVAKYSATNEGFLSILNHLRSWAMSDRVYYPLQKSSIEAFFDFDSTVARLAALRESANGDLVRELETAMEQARH
ncbi:P-loop NTPase fold protein [Pseudotabrizicola sp.]|uniref:KAP family P-loop NTPase fold protein n=1 Tax=Pseudotabrizicola sp. TaxID=2939647 RepID=UPI00272F9539|nr:P-loop NTPase fold protein [Pseudotabrizicola sp.]MDP2081359.1 P-loop NTPase fold protein [Pseudotabrizicola sp.]